jgi:asparagine synthase (glutamine-hydrolysing)
MYRLNFERDSKVCDALGVELRLPFATVEIAEFALSLPVELLLEKSNGTARKLILRGVAKNMGLPGFVVEKPKKAMQYTTGVADALKRLAKKECITLKGYLLRQFSHVFGDSENGT